MPPRLAALALLAALAPAAAHAAAIDFSDKAFAEAAVNLLFVDYLAPRCPDTAKAGPPLAGKAEAWRAEPDGERRYGVLQSGSMGGWGPCRARNALYAKPG